MQRDTTTGGGGTRHRLANLSSPLFAPAKKHCRGVFLQAERVEINPSTAPVSKILITLYWSKIKSN